jgi:hypothetical protein
MKCNKDESLRLDYFYEELEGNERNAFEEHLSNCAECKEALDGLNLTSKAMQTWKTPDANLNMVFVSQKVSFIERIKEILPDFSVFKKRPVVSFAYGLAGVFLLFSITNFEASYNPETGSVSFSAGVFGNQNVEPESNNELVLQQLMRSQEQVLELVDQIITERQTSQAEQFNTMMASFTNNFQEQREYDMKFVDISLSQMQERTGENLFDARNEIMDLIKEAGVEIKR